MSPQPAFGALVATLLLAGCMGGANVLGGSGKGRFREEVARADPSAVIAAELAFARAAQEKGQWTAFAEYATGDAVMFVPEPVNAQDWLRRQQNPVQAVKWQPHQVWSSCDGTLAATKGAWQRPDGSVGYFTTVWERQRDGSFEWVMDQGDVLAQPLAAPEFVGATVASCVLQPTPPTALLAGPTDKLNSGASRDGTLRWHVVTKADNSRTVVAEHWDGAAWQDAFREQVAAE